MNEKKIEGTWIQDLEEGRWNEEAAKTLLKKEWMGLWSYAWKNRMALILDPGTFVTETSQDADTKDLERKYQAKFIGGEWKNGKFYALMKEWKDINIEVNVQDGQAKVMFRDDDGNWEDFECEKDTRTKLDELAYISVKEAGGWINLNGIYPPNQDLVDLFRNSIENGKITIK